MALLGRNPVLRDTVAFFAFVTIATATTVTVMSSSVPTLAMLLLIAPVLLAALHPNRYLYVLMVTYFAACTVLSTEILVVPNSNLAVITAVVIVATVLACEAIRFVSRRQTMLYTVAESENRLRNYFANVPDAVFVVKEDGRIAEVNDAACELAQCQRDRLVGRALSDLCQGDTNVDFGPDYPTAWTGQFRKPNGGLIAVELSIGDFHAGKATTWIVTARDISERIEAQARLSHSEAVRTSVIENSPDLIMLLDLDFRLQFINHNTPGWAPETLGHVIFDLVSDDQIEMVRACYNTVLKKRKPVTYETRHESRIDGSIHYYESRVAPILEDGDVVGLIINASNITQRKQDEAERQELERAAQRSQRLESLGMLAGGIAHDFNNLLVAIMGRADLARTDYGNPETLQEHLDTIVDASKHAANLCQQLLAYSGKGKFFIAATTWPSLIRDSRGLMEISVPDYVQVRYELAESDSAIEADATQLKQVIVNLVSNAVEAIGPEGGTVFVRTGTLDLTRNELLGYVGGEQLKPGRYTYLEIEDNGAGMSPQTLEHLFDPFYTTKNEGTGLGMPAVLGIVQSHHGGIAVHSRQGAGTTVRVLLPSDGAIETPQPHTPAETHEEDGADECILVVDDEPAVRTVAQRMLERAGFRVLTADSGAAALATFETQYNDIDAVMLDMKMPDMSGEKVLQNMREIRPDLPVLISSGYSETEIAERMHGKGVSEFLPKPFQSQDLIAAVKRIVAATSVR